MGKIAISITATITAVFLSCNMDFIPMKTTAYCLPGITASGQEVREGICASGNKELFGKTIIVFQRLPDGKLGKIIGEYEVLDTGCAQTVIDVWQKDLESCQEYMNIVYEDGCQGNVYILVR